MIEKEYLRVVQERFRYVKKMGEDAMNQVSDSAIFWSENEDSNTIAIIVKHMSGNMISRWTDFFTTDGEKDFRDRESEFSQNFSSRHEVMQYWESGWKVFFDVLDNLKEEDLMRVVTTYNEPQSVIEAIEKQMFHYSYHVGQIVYIAKQISSDQWNSLSIPRKI
ncbi:DUF1572 family protein [Bacillus massiliigorillae]|uniref:DUF1572 family protein n=1 Tax=Bacillus massiliigorillae TaxID=1243664 RepID=UPI0003A163C8|nr:DUF1572 family protein [Bacillus massiliigorillae]